jgi:ribosomal protein S18 acetylase RimI-like enzyme
MDTSPGNGEFIISQVASLTELAEVRALFMEYASALEISLCFQNFEQELSGLPGNYAPPGGRLLLARAMNHFAGCAALRQIGPDVCEMKRLYVRPAWRAKGLGRALAKAIIEAAREIGYSSMLLDTLGSMKPAISLYLSLGFFEIAAYYANPNGNAVFMELPLDPRRKRDVE